MQDRIHDNQDTVQPWRLTSRMFKDGLVRKIRSIIAAGLVSAGIMFTTVPEARAQFGMMGGMGEGMQVAITKRGLNAYAKILDLDKEQLEAARILLEGNQAAVKALRKEMESKMAAMQEKAQDTGDWTVWQKEWPKIAKELGEKMKATEKGFFDDVKSLLSPDQADRWGSVERYRRREMGLRYSLSSGQSVDLIDALEKSKVDLKSKPDLAEIVSQYELAVDRSLVTFEKTAEDSQNKAMENMANFDMRKIEDAIKPIQDIAKSIRDLNRDYARRISPFLTDEQRAAFELEIKRRSFPRVYKESHVSKSIDAALKLPGLEDSQKDSLTTLRQNYNRDSENANQKWAQAIEQKEEKAGGKISMMMQGWWGQDGNDDVSNARKTRKEVDDKAMDRLKGILKEDQVAKLPAKEPERANWDMFDIDVLAGQTDDDDGK